MKRSSLFNKNYSASWSWASKARVYYLKYTEPSNHTQNQKHIKDKHKLSLTMLYIWISNSNGQLRSRSYSHQLIHVYWIHMNEWSTHMWQGQSHSATYLLPLRLEPPGSNQDLPTLVKRWKFEWEKKWKDWKIKKLVIVIKKRKKKWHNNNVIKKMFWNKLFPSKSLHEQPLLHFASKRCYKTTITLLVSNTT